MSMENFRIIFATGADGVGRGLVPTEWVLRGA